MSISLAEQISFETDVQYKKNDQQNFEMLKAGQKIEIQKGENVFIISKKNIPMLVFSAHSSDSQITISEASMSTGVIELINSHVEKSTDEIIENLRRAEVFIQKRDYNQASQTISILKQKYKNNSSILFMSASINYLKNDKQSAINDLQEGLVINPTNENAKKLLSKLKGGT
ncbi:MAG: hypothetical protein V4596_00035 [Bdellovibrionota bacterium]